MRMSEFDVPLWEADVKTDAIVDSLFGSSTRLFQKKNDLVIKEAFRMRENKTKSKRNKMNSVPSIPEDSLLHAKTSAKKASGVSFSSDSLMAVKLTSEQTKNSKKRRTQIGRNGTGGNTDLQTVKAKKQKMSEEKMQNKMIDCSVDDFIDPKKLLIKHSGDSVGNKKHTTKKKNKYAHLGHQSKRIKLLNISDSSLSKIKEIDVNCYSDDSSPNILNESQVNDNASTKSVSRNQKLQDKDSETSKAKHIKCKAVDQNYQFSGVGPEATNGTLVIDKRKSISEHMIKEKINKKTRKRMRNETECTIRRHSALQNSPIMADGSLSRETASNQNCKEMKSCVQTACKIKHANYAHEKQQICKKDSLPESPFDISRLRKFLAASKSNETQSSLNVSEKPKPLRKGKKATRQPSNDQVSETALHKLEMNKRKTESEPTLRDTMMKRLSAAHFRFINEQLYTSTSTEAVKMFQNDGEAFKIYHEGFQSQVEKWPAIPVDRMISYIKNRDSTLQIADFGCGDAKIAKSVPNKVHSFDLIALNKYVTVCDMKHVPLGKTSVDIVVFCLSLMGTNLEEFLCEANRVLRHGGTLLVAEVTSRFEKIAMFVKKLEKFGFKLITKDQSNTMFVWFEFKKVGEIPRNTNLPTIQLGPCTYKKR